MRHCFILGLAMPALVAAATLVSAPRVSSPGVTTVVHADRNSGRLVRTMSVAATVAPVMATTELIALIDSIAAENGVEDSLVHSLIRAESNYNPHALSPKGAMGMMQLIPATAKRFGVNNPFDIRENVQGGVKYLKFLLDYYQDNYPKAIAAYNAGEGAVDRYKGIPPYAETQQYVYRVASNLKAARTRQKPVTAVVAAAETGPAIHSSVGTDGKVYYRTE